MTLSAATPVVLADAIIAQNELGRPVGATPSYLVDDLGQPAIRQAAT